MRNAMNMMMPISHRMFASALDGHAPGRRLRSSAGRNAVIEVEAAAGLNSGLANQNPTKRHQLIVAWASSLRLR
jgi:hypothetical protein